MIWLWIVVGVIFLIVVTNCIPEGGDKNMSIIRECELERRIMELEIENNKLKRYENLYYCQLRESSSDLRLTIMPETVTLEKRIKSLEKFLQIEYIRDRTETVTVEAHHKPKGS